MKELSGSFSSREELLEDESSKDVLSQETLPKDLLPEELFSEETPPQDLSYEDVFAIETLPQDLSSEDSLAEEILPQDLSYEDGLAEETPSEDLSSEEDSETPDTEPNLVRTFRAAMQWCDEVANKPTDIVSNFKSHLPLLVALVVIILLLWGLRIFYG